MAESLHVILLFFLLSFAIILSQSVSRLVTVDGMSINQTSAIRNESVATDLNDLDLNDLVEKGLESYNMSSCRRGFDMV